MPSPTGSPPRTQTFSIRRRPLPTSLHTAKSRRTSASVSALNSRRSTLPRLSPASTATMSLPRTAPTTFLLALVMRTSLGLPPRPRLTSRHSVPLLLSLRAPRRFVFNLSLPELALTTPQNRLLNNLGINVATVQCTT
ncbi:hypothetical protein CYLTODRAFT_187928 [Cylindrobasidium torrendii FP15055 ss-10]|uniref:Uncharacterized protein n=1 Tax=Cylindrobasidium torrendii FP15055 ss-10 TaxID=1314674 RepID=A0A0D7AVV0_9AGAR|nr:hypothetical protein CYLTODRAFT_187928 [Cylindrobasidium torrendii FP15055 ss-10]